MYVLRNYQQEAVDKAISQLRISIEHILIEAAGGSGKSLMVAEIAKRLFKASGGKRVLCLQPSKELTEQNFEKYMMTGELASIYSASISKSLRHPVIYATPGTFKAVAKRMGDQFCAVSVDEAHSTYPTIQNIISDMKESNPNLRVIGFTATPYRTNEGYVYEVDVDGRVVEEAKKPYYKKLVYRITEPELIDMGYLTKPIIGDHAKGYDTSNLQMKNGKYTPESVMQTFVGHGRLTSQIVEDTVKRSYGRNSVMFFGASIDHCLEIMASLPPEQSRMISGKTHKKERQQIISDFKSMKFRYLVSCTTLTTGFDCPHVDVISILRATESHSLFTQIRVRGSRLYEDKEDYLVLDYANNIDRLFPDGDIFNPQITTRPDSVAVPLEVQCPTCHKPNSFSARKNDEGYEIDQFGYFLDLTGQQIQTEHGAYPAHYGRRCQNVDAKFNRCDNWWTHKECKKCEHKNDIAARRCEACNEEFVDPNAKLQLEFKQLKSNPREWQTDLVVSMKWKETTSQRGNEMYVVTVQTPQRMIVYYIQKNSEMIWLQKSLAGFLLATEQLTTTPRTITYKKNTKRLWEVKDYNLPTDEEVLTQALENV